MEIRLFRGLSECPANRNIIFRLYRFSFHKPIKSRLVRGRLYLPFTTYKSTTESATLRQLNSGLFLLCFIGFTTGFGKLVSAGSSASVAGNSTDFLFYLLNGKTFHKLWNCLKISITSTGEFYIVNNISL